MGAEKGDEMDAGVVEAHLRQDAKIVFEVQQSSLPDVWHTEGNGIVYIMYSVILSIAHVSTCSMVHVSSLDVMLLMQVWQWAYYAIIITVLIRLIVL
jgi:hypothetical protein